MARVTVTPDPFTLIAYDAAEIAAIVEDVAATVGIPSNVEITLEVDEELFAPLVGHMSDIVDGRIALWMSGANFEDNRRPRTFSATQARRDLTVAMLRAKDRLEEAEVLFRQYECKSCHSSDPKVPIGNRAPNFRHTRGGRLRENWIRAWLWGPSKLQPGTAMPTFFAGPDGPVAQDVQFFGGDPEAQIRALKDFIRHHYREDD